MPTPRGPGTKPSQPLAGNVDWDLLKQKESQLGYRHRLWLSHSQNYRWAKQGMILVKQISLECLQIIGMGCWLSSSKFYQGAWDKAHLYDASLDFSETGSPETERLKWVWATLPHFKNKHSPGFKKGVSVGNTLHKYFPLLDIFYNLCKFCTYFAY